MRNCDSPNFTAFASAANGFFSCAETMPETNKRNTNMKNPDGNHRERCDGGKRSRAESKTAALTIENPPETQCRAS
jgi:hypothetical protein